MSTINVNKVVDTSGGVLAPISSVFRSRIINGAMVIDQRNAGASVSMNTAAFAFAVDRTAAYRDTSATTTVQKSNLAPAGFTNSLLFTTTTGGTVSASNQNIIQQSIEGFNTADLGWGTANAQPITISFWVRSSLTGTYGVALTNSAANRCYVATYSVSSANTWEYKTITIAGDTTGTWLIDNGVGIRVRWDLGSGSTYQGTAGSWSTAFINTVSGQANVIGTNGATFYITGVQLEKGSTATSFDYRSIGTELDLCERYYQIVEGGYYGSSANGGSNAGKIYFKKTMRASATVTWQSALRNFGGGWTVGAPVGFYMTTDGTKYAHPYKTASATVQDAEFWDRYTLSAEL